MFRTRKSTGRAGLLLPLLIVFAAGCGSAPKEPHAPSGGADAAASSPHSTHGGSAHVGSAHGGSAHVGPAHGSPAHGGVSTDDEINRVAAIHGGAGPWAVAGYRMGRYALQKLGLERQSFDIEVIHRSPREVQFSCMADGAAASTGASLGKLNLSLEAVDLPHMQTVYRRKSTGQSVVLRPTAAFAARFLDVPRDDLARRGREVMELRDDEIFEEVR